MSSKQKYCNLHLFVKKNNKDLYALIDDLCAERMFKTKYPLTFLNPNKELIKKLEKLIDSGEQETALEKLKSLFIFGKHDVLNKELITYNKKEIIDSDISKMKKVSNFNQWKDSDTISVFEYTGSDFPKEGNEEKKPPISKKFSGTNEQNHRVKLTNDLMDTYLNTQDAKPVIYAVNSLLKFVKSNNSDVYEKIKLLVDPSPIITWYILVQPTKTSNKHINDNIFGEWHSMYETANLKETDELRELFTADNYDNKLLKDISIKRKSIKEVGLEDTIKEINDAYNNNYLKMLEDELRFRFGDEEDLDREHIMEMNLIDWDSPKNSLILLHRLPKSNILRTEIMNIIKEFLKTNSFLYTPYNKSILDKLENNIRGAGSSGNNPVFKIMGNSNKKLIMGIHNTLDLHTFVKMLDKKQKKELSGLLEEFD